MFKAIIPITAVATLLGSTALTTAPTNQVSTSPGDPAPAVRADQQDRAKAPVTQKSPRDALHDPKGLGGEVAKLLAAGKAEEAFEAMKPYLKGEWSEWKRCALRDSLFQAATGTERAWSLSFFDADVQATLDGEFVPGAVKEETVKKQRDGSERREFYTVGERNTKIPTTQVRRGTPPFVTSNYSWKASGRAALIFTWERFGRGVDHIWPVVGEDGIRYTVVLSYYNSDYGDVPDVNREAVKAWKARAQAVAQKRRAEKVAQERREQPSASKR